MLTFMIASFIFGMFTAEISRYVLNRNAPGSWTGDDTFWAVVCCVLFVLAIPVIGSVRW